VFETVTLILWFAEAMSVPSRTTVTGTLADRPLPHLLVYALEKKLSGTLVLHGENDDASLVFHDGSVAKMKTRSPVTYLGTVLFEQGTIDEATLRATLAEISAGQRLHGQVLLAQGAITQEQLVRGLEELTLRKLAHTATFDPTTRFEFHAGVDLLAGYARADVLTDPMPAIWVAVRDNPPDHHVASVLARAEGARFRLGAGSTLERFRLQPEERALAEQLLGDGRGVATLGNLQIMPRRTSELLLYCLIITNQVQAVAKPVPSAPLSRPGSGIPAAPPRAAGPSSVRGSSPPSSREFAMLERARTIQKEDFFHRLSVPRDATTQQIADAHAALSRMWTSAVAANEGPTREACRVVLGAVTEAHDTLVDPVKREGYVKALMLEIAHGPSIADDLAASGKSNDVDGAKACFERGELERAERLARHAVKADAKNPKAIMLLAWLEAQRESNQGVDATKARARMLSVAIHIDPDLEDAYFYRALLNKRLGNHRAARVDLKKVLDMSPSRREAAEALRECEQPAAPPRGFLDRLLKR
jgi:hypothetical protein